MTAQSFVPPTWLLKLSSRAHVMLCRLSGGRLGRTMNGLPVLLLTTTGRKSGKPHTTPIVYLQDEADYIIAPGLVERPDWYLNLKQNPEVTIKIGNETHTVEAREAVAEDRSRLWAKAPAYWNDYQKAAQGELPVIILRLVD